MLVTLLCCDTRVARAVDHNKPFGEPYELLGKRIVFTTWYFVRPGQPQWQSASGAEVPLSSSAGPWDGSLKYFEHPFGIRLIVERAQHVGPIIKRERPWEKSGIGVNTILFDNGKYRMWGSSSYFESKDGRNWERPNLGLVESGGNKDNNLINYSISGAVFIDPSAPPAQRYKTVKHSHFTPETLQKWTRDTSIMSTEKGSGWGGDCIIGATSPDGLTWTELPEPLSIEPSDTQVIAAFDQRLKKYLMFTRSHMIGPRAPGWPISVSEDKRSQYMTRRAIGRTESTDFTKFPVSQTIIEPGPELPPTDTYYTNCFTTIPGAPDQRLMFPAIYHQDEDTTSIAMFASDDSQIWHRVPGPNVLDTAEEFGTWDGGCVFAAPNLIELPNGDWALPYTGYIYPHKYPRGAWGLDVGYALWPKGRLVALEAKERGQFSTVAILAPGAKLRINAVTARAGSILVEAAGLDGKPLPGRSFDDAVPIIGDQHRTIVKWNGADTHGVEVGKPIVLRFRMDKAKLYGLEFE
jgi:hypothetical protein